MTGIEIVIVVGGVMYINKKVRERRERKKIALGGDHGAPQLAYSPVGHSQNGELRQQVPLNDDEALPSYRAPVGPPPSIATDMQWSNSIQLPTYDEVPDNHAGREFSTEKEPQPLPSSRSTPLVSQLPPPSIASVLNNSPDTTNNKKQRFWRRQSSAKTAGI